MLDNILRTTSLLLAASVKDLFPRTRLLGSGRDRTGYYHDFFLEDQLIDALALSHIEDRMAMLVREGADVGVMEMMRSNAAAYLRKKGEPLLAELLLDSDEPMAHLGRLGEHVDVIDGPLLDTLSGLKAFKLIDAAPLGRGVRIRLAAASDGQALKKLLKTIAVYKDCDPQRLAEEMGFILPGKASVWLARGVAVLGLLKEWVKRECVNKNFKYISLADPASLKGFHKLHLEVQKRVAQPGVSLKLAQYGLVLGEGGVIFDNSYWTDQQTAFCLQGEVEGLLNSSLQFISKTYNILGFECQWHLCIPEGGSWASEMKLLEGVLANAEYDYHIERRSGRYPFPAMALSVADVYGNQWLGPYVGVSGNIVYRSLLGPHDGLVALLLEKNKGALPLWLAPEHVRIVTLNDRVAPYAMEVAGLLAERSVRYEWDDSDRQLAAKVHDAEIARAPYIAVIGEREACDRKVSVRRRDSDKEAKIELNTFLNEIVQKLMEKGY